MIAADFNLCKPCLTDTTRRKKLSRLLPEGGVTARSWLMQQGFDCHAVDNLVKSDQLTSLASGVYARPDSSLTWEGLVHFLQTDLILIHCNLSQSFTPGNYRCCSKSAVISRCDVCSFGSPTGTSIRGSENCTGKR